MSTHAASDAAVLSVRGLTVAYDGRPVLRGVNLDLPAGALVGIVGPNGAGKSTLLQACVGLVPVAAGTIRVLGTSFAQARASVAYLPQRERIDWDFPIRALDVAAMGACARHRRWFGWSGRTLRDEARAALDAVGMADLADRPIGQLSGGQQQRVFVARALAQQARLFLMDEPFASVDAASGRAILDALKLLRDGGATVAVVHHDLSMVRDHFDLAVRVGEDGLQVGPARDLSAPASMT
ncbi:MAG: metal ABC transporter ATP-binding protein [Phycisphaerales bacterium]